jgi:glycosyltransferase involved in cell wall biosynthesis
LQGIFAYCLVLKFKAIEPKKSVRSSSSIIYFQFAATMNRQGIAELSLTAVVSTPRVLMVGPSLQEEGGMGTVSRLILNYVKELDIDHISSWTNRPGSTQLPSKIQVIKTFVLAWLKLIVELIFERVDVLHFHMSERGSAWRTLILIGTAYVFRKPIIVHTHGAEFHLFYETLPQLGQKLINWMLQKTSYLIVLSESWQNYYISRCQLNPNRVIVLHNPVEYPAIANKKEEAQTPIKLLFLGKINQRKGIYDLLKSFANFKQNCQISTQLLIAGSGEIESAIRLAEELKIAGDIDFLGWINPTQRNQLLSEAHTFILPSYNEGLPMALLEAMSWGLSIITTPVGGIGEVIKHQETGLLVEPGNITQLTEAIDSLVTDKSLRLTLGTNARAKVSQFSVENYSHSLSEIYWKALETYAQ